MYAGGLGLMTKQVRFRLDFESTKRSWSPSISVRGSVTKEEKERLINSLIAKKAGSNLFFFMAING